MTREELQTLIATGYFFERKIGETVELLADNIATNFTLLANIDPESALHVLDQLNSQFDENVAQKLQTKTENNIKTVANSIIIDLED